MRIWTIKDDKLYTVAYISELERFPDYLPLAEKMVDSFGINPVTQPVSTRLSESNSDNRNNERDNDNKQKNWREDPDCWYYEYFVCDENGKCDSENFDCVTDCDDGSSVTTGHPCPGEIDEGVPKESNVDSGNDPCNYYGLNVCDSSGNCDNERFDCLSDDSVNGQSGTTGQCDGDDRPYEHNDYGNDKKRTGSDCWEKGDFVGKDECDTGGLPLCSENDSGPCFDEADFPEEQDLVCQPEDDFCEPGCESPTMDCIDDVNVGDGESGDSKETATGERAYNPNGQYTCGNEVTGEEWPCGPDEEEEDGDEGELECQEEDDFCEPGCESLPWIALMM